jgi:RNA polymerase sigma factor (sigma-70 family)
MDGRKRPIRGSRFRGSRDPANRSSQTSKRARKIKASPVSVSFGLQFYGDLQRFATVPTPNNRTAAALDQLHQAQSGDAEALAGLRSQFHPALEHILLARGAERTEAEDVLAEIWSECVPGPGDRSSLLVKFSGQFSLLSWLARVSINRLIDLKRRGQKQADGAETDFDDLPGLPQALPDDSLQTLLRECLGAAFARCSSQSLTLLRLVYLHGLTQREVGRMVGWNESKTSRQLAQAMEQIKSHALKELKRRDAQLELTWEDLLGLCAGDDLGFL